jgi:hypothetical protein
MIPKLTMDGGLLRENSLLPAVKTLKAWETEGRIEIFESDRPKPAPGSAAFGWPGAPGPARSHFRFRGTRKTESGGISFQRVSAVLFPLRDPQRLNMTEVNDVAHLIRHHSLGHAIFITTNSKNFITEGKRERLQVAFKISILTPEEAVTALESSCLDETPRKRQAAE